MRFNRQFFVVICFMFAFVGQAFANATMSCDMTKHQMSSHDMHNAAMHMAMQIHESHALHSEQAELHKSEDMSTMACCVDECQCPASGCTTLFIDFTRVQTTNVVNVDKVKSISSTFDTVSLKSLYRPPIFA